MKKVLWIDTETTGITTNSMPYQFAGMIEIDGVVVEKFDITSSIFPDTEISEQALIVTGKSIDEIKSYQLPIKAHSELVKIFSKYVNKFDKNDKFIIAGHNIQFDFEMILKWFKKCGDNYFGSWVDYKSSFDTLTIIKTLQFLDMFPKTENNKLVTIAKELDVSLDFAHDAMFDIEATKKIAEKLIKIIKKEE